MMPETMWKPPASANGNYDLGVATTRHRHTERKLSGRQETKYLPEGKGGWEQNGQEKAELAQRQRERNGLTFTGEL